MSDVCLLFVFSKFTDNHLTHDDYYFLLKVIAARDVFVLKFAGAENGAMFEWSFHLASKDIKFYVEVLGAGTSTHDDDCCCCCCCCCSKLSLHLITIG